MRFISISLLFFVFLIPAYGQKQSHRSGFSRIEFYGGISTVSIRGDQRYDKANNGKVSYSFGLGTSQRLGRKVELQERLLWERKGHKETLSSTTYNTDQDYITLAVVPQFLFGKQYSFKVGAGPYLGNLQSVSQTIRYTNPPSTSQFNSMGGYDTFDYGLSINMSYATSLLKNWTLTFHLMNNIGLEQIWTWNQNNPLFPPTYNSQYALMVSIASKHC
jgi:hypothetical protein